jgi:hypothetical protein
VIKEKKEFRDIRRIEGSFAAVFDFSFLIVAQESVAWGFSGFMLKIYPPYPYKRKKATLVRIAFISLVEVLINSAAESL